MVRNVVTPARISASTVVPASVSPNCLSNNFIASIFSPFLPVTQRVGYVPCQPRGGLI